MAEKQASSEPVESVERAACTEKMRATCSQARPAGVLSIVALEVIEVAWLDQSANRPVEEVAAKVQAEEGRGSMLLTMMVMLYRLRVRRVNLTSFSLEGI